MTPEAALTPDERFDRLLATAIRKGRGAELTADLGNPGTVGEARLIFRKLRDFDGRKKLDRSVVELRYGDEIEW